MKNWRALKDELKSTDGLLCWLMLAVFVGVAVVAALVCEVVK